MCESVDDHTMKKYMDYYEIPDLNTYLNGSDAIKDIGSEFVDDVKLILEKFQNNPFMSRIILVLVSELFSIILKNFI